MSENNKGFQDLLKQLATGQNPDDPLLFRNRILEVAALYAMNHADMMCKPDVFKYDSKDLMIGEMYYLATVALLHRVSRREFLDLANLAYMLTEIETSKLSPQEMQELINESKQLAKDRKDRGKPTT